MGTTATRPTSLMAKLDLEWESRYAAVIRDFGLPESVTGKELRDRISTAKPGDRDELLYPLLTAAHAGNVHAERALVQILIPVARRMAHRVTSLNDFDDWGERVSVAIMAAWEVVRSYQLRRQQRVWANLTMGLLGILSPRKSANESRIAANTFPVDQMILTAVVEATPAPEPSAEVRLATLFTWAVDMGVLTRDDVALLARVALGDETLAVVAAELGSTAEAVRKRVARIRERLAAAAREEF